MTWHKVTIKFIEECFFGNNKLLGSLTKEQIKEIISFFRTHTDIELSSPTYRMEEKDKEKRSLIQNYIRTFFEG
jgi:hypothetical protein